VGVAIVFVIVTQKMQNAVHNHVRPVRVRRFALLACFARDNRSADGQIAQD
jgi:hypothetical protein